MKCTHSKDTPNGTIDARNPYDGKCCICGEFYAKKLPVGWPWWIDVLLRFRKTHMAVDGNHYAISKRLFGKTYIVKQGTL